MRSSVKLIRDYYRAYCITAASYRALPWHFAAATLFMLFVTGLYTLVPYLLRQTTNALPVGLSRNESVSALMLAGAYGVTWTAAHTFEWVKGILSASVLARCDAAFHRSVYNRLIRADYARLDEQDPGTLVSIIARSKGAFSAITFAIFWVIAPTVFQLILSGGVLWKVTSGSFASVFVVSMLLLCVATWKLASMSKHAHADIFSADDMLSSHLVEKLPFTLDIKVNNAYLREDASMREILVAYIKKITRGNARLALLLAGQAVCAGIVLTAFTIATAKGVTTGAFEVGDFVMIVSYVIALTAPFTTLAATLSDLRRNHLALWEGFRILDLPTQRGTTSQLFDLRSEAVFCLRKVGLSVAGRTILRDVDLEVRRGEVVTVTGPSGAGKSTLVRLMLGLVAPDSGSIVMCGSDISGASTDAICQQVAVAPQTPLILSGTLRMNLSYGCSAPPSDAFLLDLVALLELQDLAPPEHGHVLDVSLGIQGRSLSGGERQRIALGRALARHPSILILDEPTSSLDTEREARIFRRIRDRVPTIVVITHHRALMAYADRVYRLDGGKIEALPRERIHASARIV